MLGRNLEAPMIPRSGACPPAWTARCCLAAVILLASQLAAQEVSEFPVAINLPTADHLAGWDIGLAFTHRFLEPARAGSKDLYGLDEHANTGFGFDFGIKVIPGLNAEIYRTADGKTVTLAVQEQVLAKDRWRVAVRAERYDETFQGGLQGGVFQIPVDWRPFDALTLTAVPTFLSRSPTAQHVVTTGLGLRWMLVEHQGILAEYYPRPSKVYSGFEQGWSLAYQYRTQGHRFTIIATTTPGTTAHQVLGGDYEGFGPRAPGYWSLGFNLIRIF